MCFGLGFISVSKGISQAGIIGGVIGAIYVTYLNLFTSYLIIKARNRFKDDPLIVDVCDLGVKLYGDWVRPIIILTLVGTNFSFLVAYTMFMGTTSDRLVCKTFKVRECGYKHEYSVLIIALLLPIIYLRRLSNIAIFSTVVLVFAIMSIILIVYFSLDIMTDTP